MKIGEVRTDLGYTLEQFCTQLEISFSTLARIEAAERKGEQYRTNERTAKKIARHLGLLLERTISASDLEGIAITPPRPGRRPR